MGGYRAALLVALCAGHAGVARAQCVTDHEELDCCSMFVSEPPFDLPDPDTGISEPCKARPEGTVCYSFSDDYVWLLSIFGPERAQVSCSEGAVQVLHGGSGLDGANRALYLHRLDTDLVKTLRPCSGEGALDPRACNADVGIGEIQNGELIYVPAEPLRFDDVPDSGTPDDKSPPGAVSLSAPPEDGGCSVSPARRQRHGIGPSAMAALSALAFARTRRRRRA